MKWTWDLKADAITKGDKARDVSPLLDKTKIDKDGFTHYFFSKILDFCRWLAGLYILYGLLSLCDVYI